MAIVSWRLKCNFVANKGETFVEGRVHFELGASREEAEARTREYLESQHYTDIEITDCHEETWEEKYRKLPAHPAYEQQNVAQPPVQKPVEKPKAIPVEDEGTDELF